MSAPCVFCGAPVRSDDQWDTYYECGTHFPKDFCQQQSQRCKDRVEAQKAEAEKKD